MILHSLVPLCFGLSSFDKQRGETASKFKQFRNGCRVEHDQRDARFFESNSLFFVFGLLRLPFVSWSIEFYSQDDAGVRSADQEVDAFAPNFCNLKKAISSVAVYVKKLRHADLREHQHGWYSFDKPRVKQMLGLVHQLKLISILRSLLVSSFFVHGAAPKAC